MAQLPDYSIATICPGAVVKITVLLLMLLLSVPSFAANGKTVSYKSGDETVHGVLFTPKGPGH